MKKARRSRAAYREVTGAMRQQGPLERGRFQIAVYFADGDVNMYQIRQWYRPLQELAKTWPVVVIARNATGAKAIVNDGALPVAFVPEVRGVERFIERQDIRIVLYVNQNTRNFQMFRYSHRVAHLHQPRRVGQDVHDDEPVQGVRLCADRRAGSARRLARTLWDFDLDNKTLDIGRPQADHYSGATPFADDGRTVVLYAPTWEGDRPAAAYGSIATHGEALVATLLADPRYRVIYRPHPRSGVVDAAYGEANRRIIAAVASANAADPSARLRVRRQAGTRLAARRGGCRDSRRHLRHGLRPYSAVGKPLMVTRPVDPSADVDESGYLGACDWLTTAGSADIVPELTRVLEDPDTTSRLAVSGAALLRRLGARCADGPLPRCGSRN